MRELARSLGTRQPEQLQDVSSTAFAVQREPGCIVGSTQPKRGRVSMADHLKERVLEIVSIVKECPENLQPLCFELLLRDYLEGRQRPAVAPPSPAPPPPPTEQPQAQDSIAAGETSTGSRTSTQATSM
jgi:hypothetical protein